MTRDEQRAACIEVMKAAWFTHGNQNVDSWMPFIFDALHGLARVNLTLVTERMFRAALREAAHGHEQKLQIAIAHLPEVFSAMATAGDLTNPPEKKL